MTKDLAEIQHGNFSAIRESDVCEIILLALIKKLIISKIYFYSDGNSL